VSGGVDVARSFVDRHGNPITCIVNRLQNEAESPPHTARLPTHDLGNCPARVDPYFPNFLIYMKYLIMASVLAIGMPMANGADIETAKISEIVTPLCKPWTLDTGDPTWKNSVSKRVANGSSLSAGSAYLVFNGNGATGEDFRKAAILIRDAFKRDFGAENDHSLSEGEGGIKGKASSPAEDEEYEDATFTAGTDEQVIAFEVRIIPLQSKLIGVLLSFSRISDR